MRLDDLTRCRTPLGRRTLFSVADLWAVGRGGRGAGVPLSATSSGVRKRETSSGSRLDDVGRSFRSTKRGCRPSTIRSRQPWDGMTALTGVYVRNLGLDEQGKLSSWSSPSTAPTWAARCRGSRSRACSCAPATAASTTRTASAPRGRRRAACSSCAWRVHDGQLEVQAPHYPTLQDTLVENGEPRQPR